MKIVGLYRDSFEASLARGRLEAEGIRACLLNEYINSTMPWGTAQDWSVKLGVADEDYEAAMALLAPAPEEGLTERGKVCPFCGSERVKLGLRGRSGWKKFLWATLGAVMMSPLGRVEANFYCEGCKKEF